MRRGGRLITSEIRAALVAVLVARTAVNAGMRVVYPFLPAIARGLGVSLTVAAGLLALRSLAGLTAPLGARLAESVGRRTVMLGAVAVVAVGSGLTAVAPGFGVAAAGFLLVGLAKPAFDVPMQGWFGARVPYARRGRVFGATELTWALSLFIAVPASGLLISVTSWRAPFVLVAFMAVAGTVAVARLMRSDRPPEHVRRPLRLTGPRVRLLGTALAFTTASELLFVVYGAWLEDAFGLTVAAIGVFTLAVGASELVGEGVVTLFADRLGLRRTVLAGLVTSAVAYVALGWVGGSLLAALAVVIVWFVAYEITIVASIPFASELAAESRDRLLSLMVAVLSLARAIGALLAPRVYAAGGMRASGLAAAACALAGAALLVTVPSPRPTPE